METTKLSERLIVLLRYVKRGENTKFSVEGIREALSDLYCNNMPLNWCIHHVVEAVVEVLAEPRFEAGHERATTDIILAPVQGHTSIELFGPASMSTTYSVQQFYDSICCHAMGTLHNTRVDWCRDQIWPHGR